MAQQWLKSNMGTWGKFEHEDSAQNGVNRLDNELNSDNNIGSILAYQTTDADASFSLVPYVMVGKTRVPDAVLGVI